MPVKSTTVESVHDVVSESLRFAPCASDTSIQKIGIGLHPVSADENPILGGRFPAMRMDVATGHGSSELTFGLYEGHW